MDVMEPRLGLHELLHVFSFLEARDLLCAAQVDKVACPGGRLGRVLGHWVSKARPSAPDPSFPIWERVLGGPESVTGRGR